MATFRHQWRLFAEQAQGNSSESHQSRTLVAFSLMATLLVMGDVSSECDILGAFAPTIRVWRSVGMDSVQVCVYSENIPISSGISSDFAGSSGHFPAAPPHTSSKAAAQVCPRTPTSHACATHMRHDTRTRAEPRRLIVVVAVPRAERWRTHSQIWHRTARAQMRFISFFNFSVKASSPPPTLYVWPPRYRRPTRNA